MIEIAPPSVELPLSQTQLIRIGDLSQRTSAVAADMRYADFQQPTLQLSRRYGPKFKDSFAQSSTLAQQLVTMDRIALERIQLIQKIQASFTADPSLKAKYYAMLAEMNDPPQIDTEFDFLEEQFGLLAGLFSIEYGRYSHYVRQQIEEKAIDWDYEHNVITIPAEDELKDLLKYVQAQRWMKAERTQLETEGRDFQQLEGVLNQINDENFGRVLDRIIDTIGDPTKAAYFFTEVLGRELKGVHYDSPVYAIHADTPAETVTPYDDILKKYSDLFPLPQIPFSWKMINISLLSGDSFFWEYLEKQHTQIYEKVKTHMQQMLQSGYRKSGGGHHPLVENGELIQYDIVNTINYNAFMSKFHPDVLKKLGIPTGGGVISTQYAFVDYNFYIEYKPLESKKLLLGESLL